MKTKKQIFKISILTLFFTLLISCNENEQIDNPIDLSSIELDLNIDLSKGKFNLNQDINLLSKEITDLIFSEANKTNSLKIRKVNNELLINYPEKELSRDTYLAEPCKTEKKTCRSKKCVKDTLAKILGDGSRDVDIKYRRNTFSVTIEYTYKDC